MDRRRFLAIGAGWLSALLARRARADDVGAPATADGRIGAEFALDRTKVQLAGFLFASHPRPVREAIERHRRALDADPVAYLYANNHHLEGEVRRAAAAYLGVDDEEIALVDSTTMGLGLVYGAIAVRPGQELLSTTHDHYATHEALRLRSLATGAPFRRVPLYEDPGEATPEGLAARVAAEIRPETRVLAVTWVHSSTGVKLPIPRIAAAVAEVNVGRPPEDRVLLCIDGVHGLGVEDVTLPALGCDVFVAGTHKWLCGPRGTGIVWANAAGRAALAPIVPSFSRLDGWGGRMTPGGFHSFEHRWALAEAFRWHGALGKDVVQAHVHGLARRLRGVLASIPGVEVATPLQDALASGIVSFGIAGWSPRGIERALLRAGIVTKRAPYDRSYARFGPSIYTTAEEVERALDVVDQLARSTT